MGVGSAYDGTRIALQILALVDGVMLLLPLSILVSSDSHSHGDVCDWKVSHLQTVCTAAVCCFCFCFIVIVTQLILLCVAGPQSNKFALRLLWHLPLPIFGIAAGSLVTANAIWGHIVLSSGECNWESLILLATSFVSAYIVSLSYVLYSPLLSRSAERANADATDPHLPLLPVLPSDGNSSPKKDVEKVLVEEGAHIPCGYCQLNGREPKAFFHPPNGYNPQQKSFSGELVVEEIKPVPVPTPASTQTVEPPTEPPIPLQCEPVLDSKVIQVTPVQPVDFFSMPGVPSNEESGELSDAPQDLRIFPAPHDEEVGSQDEANFPLSGISQIPDPLLKAGIDVRPPAQNSRKVKTKQSSNPASQRGSHSTSQRRSADNSSNSTSQRRSADNSSSSTSQRRSAGNSSSSTSRRRSAENSASSTSQRRSADNSGHAEVKRLSSSRAQPISRRGSVNTKGLPINDPRQPKPSSSRRGSQLSDHGGNTGRRISSGISGQAGSPQTEREDIPNGKKSKALKIEERFENAFSSRRNSLLSECPSSKVEALSSAPQEGNVDKCKSILVTAPEHRKGTCERNSVTFADNSTTIQPCINVVPCGTERSDHGSLANPVGSPDADGGIAESGGSKSRRGSTSNMSGMAMMEMPVLHYNNCPINFDCMQRRESDSDLERQSDEGEEEQIKVPVWLLDKEQRASKPQRKTEDDYGSETGSSALDQHDKEEESSFNGEEDDDVADLDSLPSRKARHQPEAKDKKKQGMRISFLDEEDGKEFEKYSDHKAKERAKSEARSHSKNKSKPNVSRSTLTDAPPGPPQEPSQMFWKIPMPTRRGTMMPAQIVRGALLNLEDEEDSYDDDDELGYDPEAEDEDEESDGPVHHSVSFELPTPDDDDDEDWKKPSVLGIFNETGAKAQGLYVLPKIHHLDEVDTEMVEVRRESLVMSKAMLNDILKNKLDRERFEEIDDTLEMVGNSDDDDREAIGEIILPFFSAPQKQGTSFRQCKCKLDPESGHVIHTCMTPAATKCENTQAFQSYVCSEWSSRRASRAASRRQSRIASRARSRRASEDKNDDGEEGLSFKGRKEKRESIPPTGKSKRIRHASMLGQLSGSKPAPKKQDTDAPAKEVGKEPADSDDEQPKEDELHVSFKSLSAALEESAPSSEEKSKLNPDGTVSSGPQHTLDMKVESELGHRFELVQPWQLAQWITDSDVREHILVVDARGRDWVGAHIPLSINLRTSEIVRHPESLIKQCLRNRIHHLIFTCMYSVLRARKSAVAVEKAQYEAQASGIASYRIRISLLAGGMHAWVNHFVGSSGWKNSKNNPYIQDFDPACWCDGGPSQGGLVHVMDALWSQGGQQALSDALTAELDSLAKLRAQCSSMNGSTVGSRRGSVQTGSSRRGSVETPKASNVGASGDPQKSEAPAEEEQPAQKKPRKVLCLPPEKSKALRYKDT